MLMQELVLVKKSYCLVNCMAYTIFTDVNECATNNGNCGQVCVDTAGSYFCSCNSGYSLNANARTCSGRESFCLKLYV